MIAEKEKAVALTTAMNNELQHETYRKTAPLSSQKEQIGQLLFDLQLQSEPKLWGLFESELRRFIDLRFLGVNI